MASPLLLLFFSIPTIKLSDFNSGSKSLNISEIRSSGSGIPDGKDALEFHLPNGTNISGQLDLLRGENGHSKIIFWPLIKVDSCFLEAAKYIMMAVEALGASYSLFFYTMDGIVGSNAAAAAGCMWNGGLRLLKKGGRPVKKRGRAHILFLFHK